MDDARIVYIEAEDPSDSIPCRPHAKPKILRRSRNLLVTINVGPVRKGVCIMRQARLREIARRLGVHQRFWIMQLGRVQRRGDSVGMALLPGVSPAFEQGVIPDSAYEQVEL